MVEAVEETTEEIDQTDEKQKRCESLSWRLKSSVGGS